MKGRGRRRTSTKEDEHRGSFTFQMVLHGPPPGAADVDAGRRAEEPEGTEAETLKMIQEERTCGQLDGRRVCAPFLVAVGLLSYFGVKDGDALVGGSFSARLPGNSQQRPALKARMGSPDWTRAETGRKKLLLIQMHPHAHQRVHV